jgi:hypothetical protein
VTRIKIYDFYLGDPKIYPTGPSHMTTPTHIKASFSHVTVNKHSIYFHAKKETQPPLAIVAIDLMKKDIFIWTVRSLMEVWFSKKTPKPYIAGKVR